MVVKVSKEVAEAIEGRLNQVTKGDILDRASVGGYSTDSNKCLNSENLPLETLFKALYEGYEIEKPKYYESNLPRRFEFKVGIDLYTGKVESDRVIVMWNDTNLNCTIYNLSTAITALNSSNWVITKIIK